MTLINKNVIGLFPFISLRLSNTKHFVSSQALKQDLPVCVSKSVFLEGFWQIRGKIMYFQNFST